MDLRSEEAAYLVRTALQTPGMTCADCKVAQPVGMFVVYDLRPSGQRYCNACGSLRKELLASVDAFRSERASAVVQERPVQRT